MNDQLWLVYRRAPDVAGPVDDLIGAVKAPHWDAAVLFAQRFEVNEYEFIRLQECKNAGQRNHAEWFLATEANAIEDLEWWWQLPDRAIPVEEIIEELERHRGDSDECRGA